MKPSIQHPAARWTALGLAAVSVLGACTRTETDEQVVRVYDAYDGPEPYPNKRVKLDLPAGALGVTSDYGGDTITLIDLAASKVIGARPVGRTPIDIDGPHHVAADRARGLLFTALSYPAPAVLPGPHAAHSSGTRTGFVQRLALDDLRVLGEVRVDLNPGDIVLSEDGSRLVVSHFDLARALVPEATLDEKRALLAVLDPTQILLADSPPPTWVTVCVAPHGLVLSRPDGRYAYVACYGEDVIAVVDLDNPASDIVRVPIGPGAGPPGQPAYGPYATALSPGGDRVAIGNTDSRDVRVLDTATREMEPFVVSTLGSAYFAAWSQDATTLYIPTQGPDSLVVADSASGAVSNTRFFAGSECERPHEAVMSPNGDRVYVLCEGDHTNPGTVLILDPSTLATVGSLAVGVYPDRLLVIPEP